VVSGRGRISNDGRRFGREKPNLVAARSEAERRNPKDARLRVDQERLRVLPVEQHVQLPLMMKRPQFKVESRDDRLRGRIHDRPSGGLSHPPPCLSRVVLSPEKPRYGCRVNGRRSGIDRKHLHALETGSDPQAVDGRL
jgi:hypothetical protein